MGKSCGRKHNLRVASFTHTTQGGEVGWNKAMDYWRCRPAQAVQATGDSAGRYAALASRYCLNCGQNITVQKRW